MGEKRREKAVHPLLFGTRAERPGKGWESVGGSTSGYGTVILKPQRKSERCIYPTNTARNPMAESALSTHGSSQGSRCALRRSTCERPRCQSAAPPGWDAPRTRSRSTSRTCETEPRHASRPQNCADQHDVRGIVAHSKRSICKHDWRMRRDANASKTKGIYIQAQRCRTGRATRGQWPRPGTTRPCRCPCRFGRGGPHLTEPLGSTTGAGFVSPHMGQFGSFAIDPNPASIDCQGLGCEANGSQSRISCH